MWGTKPGARPSQEGNRAELGKSPEASEGERGWGFFEANILSDSGGSLKKEDTERKGLSNRVFFRGSG